MSITILAIDGQGKDTKRYLDLLEDTANIFPAQSALLLTSDSNANHNDIECKHISTLDYLGYSKFCVEHLTEFISTNYALCIQLDGFIINPELWQDEFLNYDYIGAPWQTKKNRPIPNGIIVGNGGFSLRSKRFLDAAAKLKWHNNWDGCGLPKQHWGNEDYFLAVLNRKYFEAQGIKFAPIELASQFSVQSGDPLGRRHILKNVFGFHGTGLLGKVRRHVESQNIYYKHLKFTKKSIFPLRY